MTANKEFKTNFIAFRFCDNDFHGPLKQAITYVAANRLEDLTLDAWREFVLRGLVAFDYLRRIENDYASRQRGDHLDYFKETLTVTEEKALDNLSPGFEGYIYDTHTGSVFYQGY